MKAAEHRHEHELAGVGPVHELGIGKPDAEAEDGAAGSAEGGGDHEGGKPKAAHVHAEIFGLARVFAQRPQMQAEGRVHDPPHREAGDH